ncbi:hypothetical protein ACVWYH_005955 [Bradyrhizobium sp. GM24.11]
MRALNAKRMPDLANEMREQARIDHVRAHNKQVALDLAAVGIPVFVANPENKASLVKAFTRKDTDIPKGEAEVLRREFYDKHGFVDLHIGATTDKSVIRRMFREKPDSLPAISCGPAGLLVVDNDIKERNGDMRNGVELFDAFCEANGGLPDGVIAVQPHYAYMAYLRHHGFPSPLLDWSGSPYVAAYFAFAEPAGENVAIYVYRERGPGGFKLGGSDEPSIRQLGPYVSGPKRHFAQKSQYTVCTHWNEGAPCFWSHDDVCQAYDPKAQFQQDIISKFVLPRSERDSVLKELDDYNLNAFTLFGSEESLMQSLSQREERD